MINYIIDASVILKVILKENVSVSNKYNKLVEMVKNKKAEFYSVKFLKTEVANGIRFGERDKELGLKIYDIFLGLPIKYITLSKQQYKNCLKLSYGLDTTVYDTSYHVLAKVYNGTFLTCDQEYYKKAKILGDIEFLE
jgi:predicted nucleic acid-binding protein